MKQKMLLKLAPTTEQHRALLETTHAFNEAANFVASVAFAEHTAHKFSSLLKKAQKCDQITLIL